MAWRGGRWGRFFGALCASTGPRESCPQGDGSMFGLHACMGMETHTHATTVSEPPPPPPSVLLKQCCRFGSLEKKPSGRHERKRLRSAETGATAALDASARAADRRNGGGGGPASQP